jgi:hypothetical protein
VRANSKVACLKRAIVLVGVVVFSFALYLAVDFRRLASIGVGLSASEVVARMGQPTTETRDLHGIRLWTHTETERVLTRRVMVFDRHIRDLVVGFDTDDRVIWTHRGQLITQTHF